MHSYPGIWSIKHTLTMVTCLQCVNTLTHSTIQPSRLLRWYVCSEQNQNHLMCNINTVSNRTTAKNKFHTVKWHNYILRNRYIVVLSSSLLSTKQCICTFIHFSRLFKHKFIHKVKSRTLIKNVEHHNRWNYSLLGFEIKTANMTILFLLLLVFSSLAIHST